MTPTRGLLCLALLSSIGLTSETADDFKNNSIQSGAQNNIYTILHKSLRNVVNVENIDEMKKHRSKFIEINNEKRENTSNFVNKTNIDVTIDSHFNNDTNIMDKKDKSERVQMFDISYKHSKSYKGNMRFWELGMQMKDRIEEKRKITLIRRKRDEDACSKFRLDLQTMTITHPGAPKNYNNNMDCDAIISAPSDDQIITLDFRDKFHLEDFPNCTYDFLEIRDGNRGYSELKDRYCGENFPPVITSSGPHLWLRFVSDDTIEYEGFKAVVTFQQTSKSRAPVKGCNKTLNDTIQGVVQRVDVPAECESNSIGRLDFLWRIEVKPNWKIFLNFTQFGLAHPNECKNNFVDVFSDKTDIPHRLKNFCGSIADTVISSNNVLHVRLFAVTEALAKTNFSAHYTAFRNKDGSTCDSDKEFDCDDATCIHKSLRCNKWPNCRLKTDEEPILNCKDESGSVLAEGHIIIILVIFSLILSSMTFVFLFKCIKKLVADHKIIKEHIRKSCEDRLDTIAGSKLALDPRLLQQRESIARHSLQRERDSLRRDNHRNSEMYKRQRTRDKRDSIDSELIAETRIDLDDDTWRHSDDNGEVEDRRERERSAKAKTRDKRETRTKNEEREPKETAKRKKDERKDTLEKKKSIDRRGTFDRRETDRDNDRYNIDRKGKQDRSDNVERREMEDELGDLGMRSVSVGAPDTKESGCQTRESLFQGGTGVSSDGTESGSGPRGFSTFGYSGSTLLRARRSPPPPAASPPVALTIELMKACPSPPDSQTKKMPDRRPMSTETTRSAPDVIIVSKPVR